MLRVREVKSYGIAACRVRQGTDGRPEILLVCNRNSYALCIFMQCHWPARDDTAMMKLFGGMSNDEKMCLRSLKPEIIWFKMYMKTTNCSGFMYFKRKFESAFLHDSGSRLIRLISAAASSPLVWEIPKGRKHNRGESALVCAMREFREETGLTKSVYRLLSTPPVTNSFIDDGIRYTSIYYIAMANETAQAKLDFSSATQLSEVSDIRWMDISAVRTIDSLGRLSRIVAPIFKCIRGYVNGRVEWHPRWSLNRSQNEAREEIMHDLS